MLLTVLICTHDRAPLLHKVLESLNAALRPEEGVELLVIANNCSDETHDLLDDYVQDPAGRIPMRWLAEPQAGKSYALNFGLPHVRTPLLAFVDDDHRVDQNFLVSICRAAADFPDSALFCGRILPDWDGREPAWVHEAGPYRIYPLPVPRFDQGDTGCDLTAERAVPGGGNLFLRTEWVRRIGGFATDMGPSGHDLGGAEDLDWVLRAMGLGARLRYVPGVVQYHYVDTSRLTLDYLMRKAYKRTASIIRLHPESHTGSIPRYLYRKIVTYGFKAAFSLRTDRRRYYLVRTAAALGEAAGHIGLRRARPAPGQLSGSEKCSD